VRQLGRVTAIAHASAVALLLATAPQADAKTTIMRSHLPVSGPVLVGRTLIWAEQRKDHGFDLWTAPVSGGQPQAIQAFTPTPPFTDLNPKLAASEQRLVVESRKVHKELTKGGYVPTERQAFSGALGKPLTALGPGCRVETENESLVPVGASDERIAYLGPSCATEPSTAQVTVSDFGGGMRRDFSFPPDRNGSRAVRVAGDFAGVFGETARIYDLRTGALVYAPPGVGVGAGPEAPGSLALRSDGAVALDLSTSTPRTYRVGWTSPAEPYLHYLPRAEAGHYHLRGLGDRLLLASGGYSDGTVSDTMLRVVDLLGRVQHVVARGAVDVYMNERFDTDGTRVAYVTRTCDAIQIHVVPVASPTRSYSVPRRCPLALAAPPRVHSGVISLKLSCRGSVMLCNTCDVLATARDTSNRNAVARRIAYVTSCPPGGQVTLRLNRRGLHLLRGAPALTLRIAARVGDPSIVVHDQPTGTILREGTLTLRGRR
jgi:hypothetical protein